MSNLYQKQETGDKKMLARIPRNLNSKDSLDEISHIDKSSTKWWIGKDIEKIKEIKEKITKISRTERLLSKPRTL